VSERYPLVSLCDGETVGAGRLVQWHGLVWLDSEMAVTVRLTATSWDDALQRLRAAGQAICEAVDAGDVDDLPF
jgi:hypothetical protein